MSDFSDNQPDNSSGNASDGLSDAPGDDPINLLQDDDEDEQNEKQDSDADSSDDSEVEENIISTNRFGTKGLKIPREKRVTPPFLTKFEKARVIGTRALQISKNSPIYVDIKDTSDPIAIAQQELYEMKIPFVIRRYMPNGDYEEWELAELEILD